MTRPAPRKPNKPASAPKGTAPAGEPFPPPLKPRRALFVWLILGFLIWVGVLVALYFKTVYPARHPASTGSAEHRAVGIGR